MNSYDRYFALYLKARMLKIRYVNKNFSTAQERMNKFVRENQSTGTTSGQSENVRTNATCEWIGRKRERSF